MSQVTLKYSLTPAIEALLAAIRTAGGRPLLVGGWVRDALMGYPSKDLDIEVFGLEVAPLKRALAQHGRVFAVGVSFGVLKVYLPDGSELDVSIPRRESRSGQRGWIVEPDPSMTLQEAASRRDFTINALLFDPANRELVDFFNGQSDLKAGILRHTGPAFVEDPLRVLRGMQFAARWDFRLAPKTIEICASLRPAYPGLAQMRIWLEWQKLAEKGLRPSAGLKVLEQTGWRACYPGLERLAEQSPTQDAGQGETAWERTLRRADAAAAISQRDKLSGEVRTNLSLAAICYDLANPVTATQTQESQPAGVSGQQDVAGVEQFLKQIGCPNLPARQIRLLVRERPVNWEKLAEGPKVPEVRRLAQRLAPATIEQWERLVEAEASSRAPGAVSRPGLKWLELARRENCAGRPPEPLLLGRHLQEAGLQPGPRFRVLLAEALEAQLDGVISNLEEAQSWLAQKLLERPKKRKD